MVLSHYPHWGEPGRWTVMTYNTGFLAVYVFFAISGYIIAYSHRDETGVAAASGYALKRIFRLYPAYLFYATAALALHLGNWTTWDTSITEQHTAAEFVAATTLVPLPGCRLVSFLGVGWSLFYEVVFYILFAAFFIGRRTGIATMALFAVAIVLNETVLHGPLAWLSSKSLLFVAGCALGLYRGPLPMARAAAWLASIGGLILLGGALLLSASPFAYPCALIGAGAITFGVIGLDHTAGERHESLVHRALHRLGDVSYSLYLCHTVVHTILFRFVGAPLDSVMAGVLFAVGPIAVAWMSYTAIERPAQRIGRALIRKGGLAASS